MTWLRKTIIIYFAWMAITILLFPITLALAIAVHGTSNSMPITQFNTFSLNRVFEFGEHILLYMIFYSALLGIFQQLFFRYLLAIGTRFWAIGTFISATIALLIAGVGNAEYVTTEHLTPWFLAISTVQALLLYRYTSWSWLWIVAHLAVARMFPIFTNTINFEIVIQWITTAGISGLVTIFVLQSS